MELILGLLILWWVPPLFVGVFVSALFVGVFVSALFVGVFVSALFVTIVLAPLWIPLMLFSWLNSRRFGRWSARDPNWWALDRPRKRTTPPL